MDQRTRMVKTLVSLAVSMTAGAALLSWLEPRPDDYGHTAALDSNSLLFKTVAQRAIRNVDATMLPWAAVEVVPVGSAAAASATLMATPPPEDLHFLVPSDGQLQVLSGWRNQQSAPIGRRVIRIGIVGADRLGKSQWSALRALLMELRAGSGTSGTLPVDVAVADKAQKGPPLARHLRTLLLKNGFLS